MSSQDPTNDPVAVTGAPVQQLDYKEYTRQTLSKLTPLLQKIALGDFSVEFEVPTEENELTELTTALSLMLDDLREYKKTQDELKEQLQNKIDELEKFNSTIVNRELKMIELKEEIASLKTQLVQCKNLSSDQTPSELSSITTNNDESNKIES